MNASILEPLNRFRPPGTSKITALHHAANKIYLGTSTGDLVIMSVGPVSRAPGPEPRSIKSFRSFSGIKHLFADNEQSQLLRHVRTFANVTGNLSPVVVVDTLPLYHDGSRVTLLLGSPDLLQVFEWVGAHLNLVKTFEEIRSYHKHAYIEFPETGTEYESDSDTATKPESPSEHGLMRYMVVSSRKRLVIFQVTRKSRNIFNILPINEIPIKGKIKAFFPVPAHRKVIIAVADVILCLNLQGVFSLKEVPLAETTSATNQNSTLGYFGLNSSGPEVKVAAIDANRIIIVRDAEAGILDLSDPEPAISASPVDLSGPPCAIAVIQPCYLLVVFQKDTVVVDFTSGTIVQTFKHPFSSSSVLCACGDSVVSLSLGSELLQFQNIPIQRQLELFLSTSESDLVAKIQGKSKHEVRLFGLERAISVLTALDNNDEFFTGQTENDQSSLKTKQLLLRDLLKEKAFLLFASFSRYHQALVSIASEWVFALHDVLPWFPSFLVADFVSESLGLTQSLPINPIKRISRETVENRKTDTGPAPGRARSQSLASKANQVEEFNKAVQCLVTYLTDQRRIHTALLNSTDAVPTFEWKNVTLTALDIYSGIEKSHVKKHLEDAARVIDTTLFLCYYYTKPMLLGPLLRLPNNKCDSTIVQNTLKKEIFHGSNSIIFMSQLLDFYYGRALHKEALDMLKSFAEESSMHGLAASQLYLSGSSLIVSYLQRLSDEHLDLIFETLEWIAKNDDSVTESIQQVFMSDTFECESYDNFRVVEFLKTVSSDVAIRYLEWLIHESDILESPGRQAHVRKLTTSLCLLYLQQLMEADEEGEQFEALPTYKKLYAMLDGPKEVEPWTLLKSIPTTEDKYLRFAICVYRRLGEHQKSLDILYNQLSDFEGAMEYSALIWGTPGERDIGLGLFFKLFEDLLMHFDENQEQIAQLLVRHGTKLPVLEVLTILPDTFPIHKVEAFFQKTVLDHQNKLDELMLQSSFYRIGLAKIHEELVDIRSESYTIESARQLCGKCQHQYGHKLLCVGDDNQVVHYTCLS